MEDINNRQNDDKGIRLLKASSQAYSYMKRYEIARYVGALIVAVASIVSTTLGKTLPALTISAAAWAIVSTLVLTQIIRRLASEAATIQEHFDTFVYDLPWPQGRSKIEHERIHELSSKYAGDVDNLRDWYPDVSGAPRPFDILICQRSNVAWDISLRKRWMATVRTALIVWISAGVAIGVFDSLSVSQVLLRWFIPSLALIFLCVEIIRTQRQIINDRNTIGSLISGEIEWKGTQLTSGRLKSLLKQCREIQNTILATRSQVSAVPQFFYRHFRGRDQSAMASAAEELS